MILNGKNKLALVMQLTTECNLRITTNARSFYLHAWFKYVFNVTARGKETKYRKKCV